MMYMGSECQKLFFTVNPWPFLLFMNRSTWYDSKAFTLVKAPDITLGNVFGMAWRLAHRYATFLCSLDVDYLTRPNKSSRATNYLMMEWFFVDCFSISISRAEQKGQKMMETRPASKYTHNSNLDKAFSLWWSQFVEGIRISTVIADFCHSRP